MTSQKEKLWRSQDPFIVWLKDSRGFAKKTIVDYYYYWKKFKELEEYNQQ